MNNIGWYTCSYLCETFAYENLVIDCNGAARVTADEDAAGVTFYAGIFVLWGYSEKYIIA